MRDGNVIFATSTDVQDRLGYYLLTHGLVSNEDFVKIAAERDRSKERAGVLMIRHRLLSPAALRGAITGQIDQIAWSLFSWDSGTICFHIKEHKQVNPIRIQLPLRHMVFRGVRDKLPTAHAEEHLGDLTRIYEGDWEGEELIDIGLEADEYELLQLIDGKRALNEVLEEAEGDRDTNLRLIFAFEVLRLVRAKSVDKNGVVRIRLQTAGGGFS